MERTYLEESRGKVCLESERPSHARLDVFRRNSSNNARVNRALLEKPAEGHPSRGYHMLDHSDEASNSRDEK